MDARPSARSSSLAVLDGTSATKTVPPLLLMKALDGALDLECLPLLLLYKRCLAHSPYCQYCMARHNFCPALFVSLAHSFSYIHQISCQLIALLCKDQRPSINILPSAIHHQGSMYFILSHYSLSRTNALLHFL
jgi:hypothetical protein